MSSDAFSDITLLDIESVILTDLNDYFMGDSNDNTITAGDGDDEVLAGDGDDTIIELIGTGDDIYNGGAGIDLVDYSNAQSELVINLQLSADQAVGADIGTDQLINIESVLSGTGNDELVGDASNNYFNSGGGADFINAGDGDDVVFGGGGNDWLDGGAGADVLTGGSGRDVFAFSFGEAGNSGDIVSDYTAADDVIYMGGGTSQITPTVDGADVLVAGVRLTGERPMAMSLSLRSLIPACSRAARRTCAPLH